MAYKSGPEEDWNKHREARRAFKKLVRRCKRECWQNFCYNVEGTHESSRFNRILGNTATGKLGMLRMPNGKWTESSEEVIQNLLQAHFPGCVVVCEDTSPMDSIPQCIRWSPSYSWEIAKSLITVDRIKWAFESMAPYKSPGEDGILPALVQHGMHYAVTSICKLYRASLATGYIPLSWRIARVSFIPKPGRLDYTNSKVFRPISLTSFLLTGLEKLVYKYLRSETLVDFPLHSRQHAYQAGKSTESALHQLVERVERALVAKQYSLSVFFDIVGAFYHTSTTAVRKALEEKKVVRPVIEWIVAMIGQRTIYASQGVTKLIVNTFRVLPQGGVISPTMWALVADSLLKWLSKQGIYTQGFADDSTVLIIGAFYPHVARLCKECYMASRNGAMRGNSQLILVKLS